MKLYVYATTALTLSFCLSPLHADDSPNLRGEAVTAMKKAATFHREQVATHGGYVYFYSLDLKQRWGEGVATPDASLGSATWQADGWLGVSESLGSNWRRILP